MNRPVLDIDAIVREVAQRLAAELVPPRSSPGQGHTDLTSAEPCTGAHRPAGQPGPTATPQPDCPGNGGPQTARECRCGASPRASSHNACENPPTRLVLHERVVSAAALAGRLAGIHELHVPQRAIITPAACDLLRQAGAVLVRAEQPAPRLVGNSLVLAAAETNWPASGLVSALAAAGIGLEQLARCGLRQAVHELADHAARGGRKGLLLTTRPYLGACLANRRAGVRAVAADPRTDPQRAVDETAANILVLDPAGWPTFALHRLVRSFAVAGSRPCPLELQHEGA